VEKIKTQPLTEIKEERGKEWGRGGRREEELEESIT